MRKESRGEWLNVEKGGWESSGLCDSGHQKELPCYIRTAAAGWGEWLRVHPPSPAHAPRLDSASCCARCASAEASAAAACSRLASATRPSHFATSPACLRQWVQHRAPAGGVSNCLSHQALPFGHRGSMPAAIAMDAAKGTSTCGVTQHGVWGACPALHASPPFASWAQGHNPMPTLCHPPTPLPCHYRGFLTARPAALLPVATPPPPSAAPPPRPRGRAPPPAHRPAPRSGGQSWRAGPRPEPPGLREERAGEG